VTLSDVRRFQVPRDVVVSTEDALTQAGRDGYERFVLWSGTLEQERFVVRTSHLPEQKSYRLSGRGLLVRVEGEALHQLNAQLYEACEILGVQIHAHPTTAFHSYTDDTFPIVTTLGGLSIVAPDFCCKGLFVPDTAVYRLEAQGWVEKDASLVEVI
jgi:hypothetical protein